MSTAFKCSIFAALLITSAFFSTTSNAGQATGNLGVSLTISSACAVDSGYDARSRSYSVTRQSCSQGGEYQVRTEHANGHSETLADKPVTQVTGDAQGDTRVTLYW
ncbi:hypothetical protein [Pseudomonas sp. USHLN015]|uniref:hypothetical protein n=1 Tax=Pseudomonas sp. USHLN015 TaxID=3081296 RepID=UPI00301CB80D